MLSSAVLCNQPNSLESVSRGSGQGLKHNPWVVRASFPAMCFPAYQKHHSDVLWFWPALFLSLSLSAHVQQRATSLSQPWWRKWNKPGSFHPATERRKKDMQRWDCHSCACSCPLKNVAELSAQLQFYRIWLPRQLSNEWHVLHPPQFVHFHQPKIAHKASIFYRRFHFWHLLFLGLIRYCIRMIAMGFLLGGGRKSEKWRVQYRKGW